MNLKIKRMTCGIEVTKKEVLFTLQISIEEVTSASQVSLSDDLFAKLIINFLGRSKIISNEIFLVN